MLEKDLCTENYFYPSYIVEGRCISALLVQ